MRRTAGPAQYFAKHYFASPEDPRDRLGTEYGALQWLRARGVARIPAAVGIDREARCGVYEFLPGTPASRQPASDRDVEEAVAFLAELRTLARQSGPDVAAAASEAYLSIGAVIEHVLARAERLRAVPGEAPQADALRGFMTSRFTPFAASLAAWTTAEICGDGLSRDEDLPLAARTLSPSDFGFHNALRDGEGRLTFVDFEYFGWDDPAKTIADFLLHPAMEMTGAQRRAFAAGITALFDDAPQLAARARLLYPWFGLNWALILLNEYLPDHLGRRQFAADAVVDRGTSCAGGSKAPSGCSIVLPPIPAESLPRPHDAIPDRRSINGPSISAAKSSPRSLAAIAATSGRRSRSSRSSGSSTTTCCSTTRPTRRGASATGSCSARAMAAWRCTPSWPKRDSFPRAS